MIQAACEETCSTCTGELPYDCLTCENQLLLCEGFCLPSCLQGYYLNDLIQECLQCQAPCKTCLSHDVCLSCVDLFYLYEEECLSESQCVDFDYHYVNEDGHLCSECHASCLSCAGPYDDQCLRCNYLEAYSKEDETILGKCERIRCKEGLYEIVLETGYHACEICHESCLTCIEEADHCTSCPVNSFLIESEEGISCLTCSQLDDGYLDPLEGSSDCRGENLSF
jgi:proprotein convertase subtilisin/kexin type 5